MALKYNILRLIVTEVQQCNLKNIKSALHVGAHPAPLLLLSFLAVFATAHACSSCSMLQKVRSKKHAAQGTFTCALWAYLGSLHCSRREGGTRTIIDELYFDHEPNQPYHTCVDVLLIFHVNCRSNNMRPFRLSGGDLRCCLVLGRNAAFLQHGLRG